MTESDSARWANVRNYVADLRYFDDGFLAWIAQAAAEGRDPNDIADARWGDVRHLVDKHYLPRIGPDAVVLELGPGTGRVTRHIFDRCGRLVLADHSAVVVDWMTRYLTAKGKRDFQALLIDDCRLAAVEDLSVDTTIADGVFHHLNTEDIHRFLAAFRRVLRPGGYVVVNFVSLLDPDGYVRFRANADASDDPDLFRWQHPETIRLLAQNLSFEDIELTQESVKAGAFVCYLSCRKPPR